jgi:hypothetical protein
MMFALWIAVMRLRPCARVLEGEPRDPRRRPLGDDLQAFDHAGHDLVFEAGVEIFRVLAHDDQVHVVEAGTDVREIRDRLRFAYRSSALRKPTLTLENPPPMGVPTGPFSATLFRRIDSMRSSGSGVPCVSTAFTPAS